MRTVTHQYRYEIFVRTFTNIPNLPIIIPSSYHAKIFVRTFTNIPKLPTIIIPSSSPNTIPEIVSGSGIKFTGHFQKKVTLCAHTCYCNG